MTDSTRPKTAKMIRAPKPSTEQERRNKDWPYPKELFHAGGTSRVVWSPEEHAEAKSEGWTDSPEEGKKYVTWTAELPPEHKDNDAAAPGEADRLCFQSQAARNDTVFDYTERRRCSEAALARMARVHPSDLSKWKTGALPATSEKKARIERILKENQGPIPRKKQPAVG